MPDESLSPLFEIRQCTRPSCGLRFSIETGDRRGDKCPVCRAPAELVKGPYGQAEVSENVSYRHKSDAAAPEVEVLLDNIRSAWNVGAMLRTADGAGVRKVHLCGVTATPDNPKVWKTSLGAEKTMPWSFAPDGLAAARAIKASGLRLWALEGGERAVSLFDHLDELPGVPILLIAGNEVTGVDPDLIDICDRVVALPMQGMKGSLNVAVAFGIAVYTIRFGSFSLPS